MVIGSTHAAKWNPQWHDFLSFDVVPLTHAYLGRSICVDNLPPQHK
jgi:hypothetical protein